jgi:hypothetical protein
MLIFVAKILWSTTHAPQNAYMGAPQKRFSLLVPSSPSMSRTAKKSPYSRRLAMGEQETAGDLSTPISMATDLSGRRRAPIDGFGQTVPSDTYRQSAFGHIRDGLV